MRSMLRSGALIEAWFDTLLAPQRELARRVRDAVLAAEPSLHQAIKWGNLVFSLQRRHALAIVVYKDHVNLQVFNGARLVDRHPALQGSGESLRHLRLRLGEAPDAAALGALVADCVAEMRAAGGEP
jgi:hypothetical protein